MASSKLNQTHLQLQMYVREQKFHYLSDLLTKQEFTQRRLKEGSKKGEIAKPLLLVQKKHCS